MNLIARGCRFRITTFLFSIHLYLHKSAGQRIELKTWNSQYGVALFKEVSIDDIKGEGQIKAVGSVAYADKGRLAQTSSPLGNNGLFMDQAVLANISPSKLGETLLFATGLDTVNGLYKKDARLYEMAEQSQLSASLQNQVQRAVARPTMDEMVEAMEAQDAELNA